MEAFRDAVNAGNNFQGKTVRLAADITLRDGWKPIGEGSRKVGGANIEARNATTFFRGTFDGAGKTISHLNNKGFAPTQMRLVRDGNVDTYAYGLFALVGDGAEVKNLTLSDVDIDTNRYTNAIGDSVGALIGYSDGSLKVEGVTVNGNVVAGDAVGGLVGRSYNSTGLFETVQSPFAYTISGCTNNANVTAGTAVNQKGAGFIGFASVPGLGTTITNNTNNGTITGGQVKDGHQLKASIALINWEVMGEERVVSGNKNGSASADALASWKQGNTTAIGALD